MNSWRSLGEAHAEDDHDTLRRIYDYAEWCFRQRSKNLWNSVAVSFYEHLFDQAWMSPLAAPWLKPHVVKEVMTLWEARLSEKDLAGVRALLRQR